MMTGINTAVVTHWLKYARNQKLTSLAWDDIWLKQEFNPESRNLVVSSHVQYTQWVKKKTCTIYTVSQKKLCHYTFVHNFDRCWPICKILSLLYFPNLCYSSHSILDSSVSLFCHVMLLCSQEWCAWIASITGRTSGWTVHIMQYFQLHLDFMLWW